MKKILGLIIIIIFVTTNIYSKENNCQLYKLIIEDLKYQYLNRTVDSIPDGQKIDPENPYSTKMFKVKKDIYLDLFVSQNLFNISKIDYNNWAIKSFYEKGKIGKLVSTEKPSLKDCITDSIISSRFDRSTKLIRFSEKDYRIDAINGKRVLLNPMRITFSNIVYMDNRRAIVYLETLYGTNPGVISYYYIFKRTKGNWVIENSVCQTL